MFRRTGVQKYVRSNQQRHVKYMHVSSEKVQALGLLCDVTGF